MQVGYMYKNKCSFLVVYLLVGNNWQYFII